MLSTGGDRAKEIGKFSDTDLSARKNVKKKGLVETLRSKGGEMRKSAEIRFQVCEKKKLMKRIRLAVTGSNNMRGRKGAERGGIKACGGEGTQ